MERRPIRFETQWQETVGSPIPPRIMFPSSAPRPTRQKDMRWSEMVPANSALAFGVTISDEHDPVAFTGAELLRARNSLDRTKSVDGPLDVTDGQSQMLSVLARSSVNPLSTIGPGTATLAYFQDTHADFFQETTEAFGRVLSTMDNPNRPMRTRTQTSSTIEGLDVYLRGSMLATAHRNNRHYSCFDGLEDGFEFDPRTSFDRRLGHVFDDLRMVKYEVKEEEEIIDEGFSETPLLKQFPTLLPPRTTSKSVVRTPKVSTTRPNRSTSTLPPASQAGPRTTSPRLPPIPTASSEDWRWSAVSKPTDPAALSSLRFTTQSEAQRRRLRKSPADGRSTPSSQPEASPTSDFEMNHRRMAQPLESIARRSIPAAPDVVLRRGFYNHQLPSVRESDLTIHDTKQGLWTAPRQYSTKNVLLHQQFKSHPPLSVVSRAPKAAKGSNKTLKHLKKSVRSPEKDGWVYVDVKQR